MFSRFSKIIRSALAIFSLAFVLLAGTAVLAQATIDTGIDYGAATGLAGTDIRTIIANIIRVFLGLLGIIALGLVIYGGFLYMTAAGNEEQIETAKKYLKNAAIGLAIILSSLAIVQFVIHQLGVATTGGGAVVDCVTNPADPACLIILPPGPSGRGVFYGKMAPVGEQTVKNIVLSFSFYQGLGGPASVDFKTVNRDSIKIAKKADNSQPPGDFRLVTANLVEFHPTGSCADSANPANSDPSNTCFEKSTLYFVQFVQLATSSVKSTDGRPLTCSTAHPCEFEFKTGEKMDIDPPEINLYQPAADELVSTDSQITLGARFKDDAGVKLVQFFNGERVLNNVNVEPVSDNGFANTVWSTIGILGEQTLKAHAYDVDNHNTMSAPVVRVRVLPAHCFDGVKNFDETGIDCGDPPDPPCALCDGGACTVNSNCAGGFCQAGKCVSRPKITNISPLDGVPGNYITIYGRGFGAFSSASSTIKFLGIETINTDDKTALVVDCFGRPSWKDNAIVVKVPDGAVSGPLQVGIDGPGEMEMASTSLKQDKTNDNYGPVFPAFNVGGPERPGLCGIQPAAAAPLSDVDLAGTRLANISYAYFGLEQMDVVKKTSELVSASVPNLLQQTISVSVKNTDGVESNTVPFKVLAVAENLLPRIDAIDPKNGPVGTYVTITGVNFGSTMPEVWFQLGTDRKQAFKPDCAIMTANQLIVKVPKDLGGEGRATITVVTTAGTSNSVIFTIDTTPLRPGLCSLEPDNGPVNALVTLTGEGFGNTGNVVYGTLATSTLDALSWIDTKATDRVPALTVNSVPIKIWNTKLYSNALNYKIGDCSQPGNACAAGKVCCEGSCRSGTSCVSGPKASVYSWYFSTGKIPLVPRVIDDCDVDHGARTPTPSPTVDRDGGNNVCLNALINTRFTTLIQNVDISSFAVERCADSNCENGLQIVPGSLSFEIANGQLRDGFLGRNSVYDRVIFTPANAFAASTWYRVRITTAVRSFVIGSNGYEDTNAEAAMAAPYSFKFKTGTENCELEGVVVGPNEFTSEAFNTTYDPAEDETLYSATAMADSKKCLTINNNDFDWTWNAGLRLGASATYAEVTNYKEKNMGSPDQDLKTLNEVTPDGGGDVWAKTENKGKIFWDNAKLYVKIANPKVIDWWPKNCNAVCSNAEVAAVFNVTLDANSLNTANVKLCEVAGPESTDCGTVDGFNWVVKTTRIENDTILFNHSHFKAGTYYRVILRGKDDGVKSAAGRYMADEIFSWYFKTKIDGKVCSVNKVSVAPETSMVSWVGATAPVEGVAFGAPDECSLNGQRLNSWDYDWRSWTASPGTVASITDFDRGQSSAAGLACSNSCLHPGRGATAVGPCGGSITGAARFDLLPLHNGPGTFSAKNWRDEGDVSIKATVDGESDERGCIGNRRDTSGLMGLKYCANATTTYSFTLPEAGSYTLSIFTGNDPSDIGNFTGAVNDGVCANQTGIDHHLRVFWDGKQKADVCRSATLTPLAFSIDLGAVIKAKHEIQIVWDNDFNDIEARRDSNLVIYKLELSGRCEGPVTALCGNGVIDVGEDCDPAIPLWRNTCDERCLKKSGGKAGTDLLCTPTDQQECCGNGNEEFNESCDLGENNGLAGSSCTARCLKSGTKMSMKSCTDLGLEPLWCAPRTISLCGDGLVAADAGEECDAGANNDRSASGCTATCLKTAKLVGRISGSCGDGVVNSANNEECDGERWCSSTCQNLGSSYAYGSFCGDGIIGDGATGNGEDCDSGAGIGDGRIDPWQLAKAMGGGPVVNKQQVADIIATTENKTGSGKFILQCGFTPGDVCSSCSAGAKCLVGNDSCCYPQPTVTLVQPQVSSNVCPNTAISLQFSDVMSQPSFSSSTKNGFYNLILAKKVDGDVSCQSGSFKVSEVEVKSGSWWSKWWSNVRQWFGGEAGASTWPSVYCDYGGTRYKLEFAENSFNGKPATLLTVKLDKLLDSGVTYRIYVKPQIKNEAGIPVDVEASGLLIGGLLKEFKVRDEGLCKITEVSMEPAAWWFNTAVNKTEDDNAQTADDVKDANIKDSDRIYTAHAFYKSGTVNQELQPMSGIYDWTYTWTADDVPNGRLVVLSAVPGFVKSQRVALPATNPQNGTAEIRSKITITADTSTPSTKDKTFNAKGLAQIFLCENPWPNGTFNDVYGLGLVDAVGNNNSSVTLGTVVPGMTDNWTNLKLLYCRDAGKQNDMTDDLPKLNLQAVIPRPSVSSPSVDLIKEFFFTFDAPESGSTVKNDRDSIGVRVYKNTNHLSLLDWYKGQNLTGASTPLKVGKYDALQVGRTYYIDALNVSGYDVYSNVYVFTFSDEPIAETVEVINQLLANLVLNVNVPNPRVCLNGAVKTTQPCTKYLDCPAGQTCDAPLDKLYRDYSRIKDLQLIADKLWTYRQAKGEYPKLDENPALGTYLPAYTNDKWRSWQGVLGNALGYSLPVDPLDNFYGCGSSTLPSLANYDANTCWDAVKSQFICPVNSHVYHYQVIGNDSVKLKADVESIGAYTWKNDIFSPTSSIKIEKVGGCNGSVAGVSSVCGDGVVGAGETCEKDTIKSDSCDVNGYNGTKTSTCNNDCKGWGLPTDCVSSSSCGNGIKDEPEECDDGAANGRYGKCGTDCKRPNNNTNPPVSAGFCGNRKKDVTTAGTLLEVCDSSTLFPNSGSVSTACRSGNGWTKSGWCKNDNTKLCSISVCMVESSTYGAPDEQRATSVGCPSNGECVNEGAKYAINPTDSCSWDCQSYDYCGDGKLNAKYEDCEKSESCQVGTCSDDSTKYCEQDSNCNSGGVTVNTCTAKRAGKRYCKALSEHKPQYVSGALVAGEPGVCKGTISAPVNGTTVSCGSDMNCYDSGGSFLGGCVSLRVVDDTSNYQQADSICKWDKKLTGNNAEVTCLPTAPPPATPGACGDGVTNIESEVCDAGIGANGNGHACSVQSPLTSCTYCAYGCQEVITVSN